MKHLELDTEEKAIEHEAGSWQTVTKKRRVQVEAIIDAARKSKNINIRISENDLDKLKERSTLEGLPYQTLVASVLHKYVTDQLVDEHNILKSLQLLQVAA